MGECSNAVGVSVNECDLHTKISQLQERNRQLMDEHENLRDEKGKLIKDLSTALAETASLRTIVEEMIKEQDKSKQESKSEQAKLETVFNVEETDFKF